MAPFGGIGFGMAELDGIRIRRDKPTVYDATEDAALAQRLLDSTTGPCTSTAYSLFNQYFSARDLYTGPTHEEIVRGLQKIANR